MVCGLSRPAWGRRSPSRSWTAGSCPSHRHGDGTHEPDGSDGDGCASGAAGGRRVPHGSGARRTAQVNSGAREYRIGERQVGVGPVLEGVVHGPAGRRGPGAGRPRARCRSPGERQAGVGPALPTLPNASNGLRRATQPDGRGSCCAARCTGRAERSCGVRPGQRPRGSDRTGPAAARGGPWRSAWSTHGCAASSHRYSRMAAAPRITDARHGRSRSRPTWGMLVVHTRSRQVTCRCFPR